MIWTQEELLNVFVKEAYERCEGNISAAERMLRSQGKDICRRTISKTVKKLGLKKPKRPRK